MPNKNYEVGRRKEYKRMAQLKEEGWTVMRTAGSHGVFDLIAIKLQDTKLEVAPNTPFRGRIRLLQIKGGESKESAIRKIAKGLEEFDGVYMVEARAE